MTGISFVIVKTKGQSKQQCTHIYQTSQKIQTDAFFARRLIVTIFWERKGVVIVEFMQQDTTVISKVYCKTLKISIGLFKTKDIEC
jgi:hypothetical protein